MTVLPVYVNDILVTGNDSVHIASLITYMHTTFSMKELGLINYFLGVSVTSSDSGYFHSQTKYALKILAKAGMSDCKLAPSLMSVKPSSLSSPTMAYSNPFLYRSIVANFASVKHLLRYLKGTIHQGLSFTPGPLELHAFSDSDWAGSGGDESIAQQQLKQTKTQQQQFKGTMVPFRDVLAQTPSSTSMCEKLQTESSAIIPYLL
ncbi:uncharacterized protein LOC114314723 [Camellia sinensis]|uniref:uncharacterized protein LOC114314723 n=1 Tax=Camellia sinensis TaxID=4442 RepID=UPI001036D477|nr:uncharacterized protein LOC114314723 [Camellia sinensis]